MKKIVRALASALVLVGTADAALLDRGGGMIYDATLNITWLADWNYSETSGYARANAGGTRTNQIQSDGRMGWDAANNWATTLVYGGYDDWRLPTSRTANGAGTCSGYNCSGSEMGHMFYEYWGATAVSDFSTGMNAGNLALFANVQSYFYWSGTEYPPATVNAWYFGTSDGGQNGADRGIAMYAIAVRPGDVVTSVPEPTVLALVIAALLGVAATGRRSLEAPTL